MTHGIVARVAHARTQLVVESELWVAAPMKTGGLPAVASAWPAMTTADRCEALCVDYGLLCHRRGRLWRFNYDNLPAEPPRRWLLPRLLNALAVLDSAGPAPREALGVLAAGDTEAGGAAVALLGALAGHLRDVPARTVRYVPKISHFSRPKNPRCRICPCDRTRMIICCIRSPASGPSAFRICRRSRVSCPAAIYRALTFRICRSRNAIRFPCAAC